MSLAVSNACRLLSDPSTPTRISTGGRVKRGVIASPYATGPVSQRDSAPPASPRQTGEGEMSQSRGRIAEPFVVELHARRMVVLGLGVDSLGRGREEDERAGDPIENAGEVLRAHLRIRHHGEAVIADDRRDRK